MRPRPFVRLRRWGRRRPRTVRFARALLGLLLAPLIALVVRAATLPLPATLSGSAEEKLDSVVYLDAHGGTLREVRAGDAQRAITLGSDEIGELALAALVCAEDARFFRHPGVDPLAVLRAAFDDVRKRRIVSGASTLTMQLARIVSPHAREKRRTLRAKLDEAALALRIEASLDKKRILLEYANRAPFGDQVRGIGAASRHYFDKPPTRLSAAEAATLASLPRGPSLYAMVKRPEVVVKRRNRVLSRMFEQGAIDRATYERAVGEPLSPHVSKPSFGAPHFVEALARGELGAGDLSSARRVTTTLDPDLQREAESLARATVRPLEGRHVTAAAAVVLDNATGEILAYVGSPNHDDERHGGKNDGVRAERQPGSTLKPFVYALAMEQQGFTGATSLPDVALSVEVASGIYRPMNYDERFHGPVRLREALGSSYNVPAVWTLLRVGEDALLERLHALGFTTLREDARYYGPALALGDGEVRLLDLANAYATLARGGEVVPLAGVREVEHTSGSKEARGSRETSRTRVMPRSVAAQISDILRDRTARAPSFGERSALELPFEVAVKTGTSKGFRDNYTVGYTDRFTVAVWVGNFDGSAMQGVSGVTGAAPLFRGIMLAAMRGHEDEPLEAARSDELEDVEVCALSGGLPTNACGARAHERLPTSSRRDMCTMHQKVAVDSRNGLRAGDGCPRGFVSERVVESYPDELVAWAKAAGRPLAPVDVSPHCPDGRPRAGAAVRILSPRDGAHFVTDPDRPLSHQTVPVTVSGEAGARVRLRVDGRLGPLVRVGDPLSFRLSPGKHELVVEVEGGAESAPVHVDVD